MISNHVLRFAERHPSQRSQRGAVLIVGLIMLLVLTMIGLTAMQTTTQQERMAGNLRDRNFAFQAAEMALREGESVARDPAAGPFTGAGLYEKDGTSAPIDLELDASWAGTNAIEAATVGPDLDEFRLAGSPRYMVERQPVSPGLEAGTPQNSLYFKVSARGVGGSDTAVVVLQSSYRQNQ